MTPFEYVIWDAEQCAEYLKQPIKLFKRRIRFLPGFPLRLSRIGMPRFRAQDVVSWHADNPDLAALLKRRTGGRTALYRHYDSAGNLLYVGISLSVINRLRAHDRQSPWFPLVAKILVEHFNSRGEARIAEKKAITTERPRFNYHMNESGRRV